MQRPIQNRLYSQKGNAVDEVQLLFREGLRIANDVENKLKTSARNAASSASNAFLIRVPLTNIDRDCLCEWHHCRAAARGSDAIQAATVDPG